MTSGQTSQIEQVNQVVSLFVDLVSTETEYERESRYKDCGLNVRTAGCPNPAETGETAMLRCMNAILSCPEGEQYHCTRQRENPIYYIDGCAKSTWCLGGEAPYLIFKDEYGRPSTNLHIVCDWCHNENFYNSADRTNSSTYFECKKKVRCDFKYGFECHIEYPDVFKHNRKCGCNTSADAIFRNDNIDLKNASQVDSNFCTSVSIANVVECIYSPCSVGYERSKNQSCVKKPLPSSSHPTYKPTESINNDSSVSTSQRVLQSSTSVKSTVTVSTTQKQPQGQSVAEPSFDYTVVFIVGAVVLIFCTGIKESQHITNNTTYNIGRDYNEVKNNKHVNLHLENKSDDDNNGRTDDDNDVHTKLIGETSPADDSKRDTDLCTVQIEGPDQVSYSKNLHTQPTNNETPEAGVDRMDEVPSTSQSNEDQDRVNYPKKLHTQPTNDATVADRMDEEPSTSQPNNTSNSGCPIIQHHHHHHNYGAPNATNFFGGDNDIGTINCNPPTGQLFLPKPNIDFKSMDDSSHTQPDEISEIDESLKTDGSAEINGIDAFDLESLKMLNTKLKSLEMLDELKKTDNSEAFRDKAVRIDTDCEEYKSLRRDITQKHDVKISGDQIESPSVFCPDGYQRLKSTGDGNCLFNSVSLLLFGTEELSSFLRLYTAVTAAQNWRWYIKQLKDLASKWNISVMKYLEIDRLTLDETEKETDEKRIADAVKRLIMEVANNNQYMNPYLHMQFLSDAIKRKIYQYFEDANIASHVMETQNPAKQYDEVVPCLEEDICDTPIHILWVNMSGNTKGGLNHIVPLVKCLETN